MTDTETLKILAVLRGAYPAFYRDMQRKEAERVAALWAEMFREEPYEIVAAAVKALIVCDEKGYPPHIGAVKARIRQITAPQEMTEAEAWGLVNKAISRSIYNSRQEFEKLPKLIQGVVGGPSQLRDWAVMDADTVQSVVASNFQRSYRARAASDREYKALPPEVRAILDVTAGKLALKEGET